MSNKIYDHGLFARLRSSGCTWAEIRDAHHPNTTVKKLQGAHQKWRKRSEGEVEGEVGFTESEQHSFELEATVTAKQFRNVRSLEDLLQFFDVDTDVWEVKSWTVRGTEWDQNVEKGTVAQSVRLSAQFARRPEKEIEDLAEAFGQLVADAAEHTPSYEVPKRPTLLSAGDDPVIFELALYDPHFGMLAWRHEVGQDYDLSIASREYVEAVEGLLAYALMYPTERILYVVGNDFLHVDTTASAPGGMRRGGATTRGTPQDIDGRQEKMFTEGRRALVAGIDLARTVAPVDVVVVAGNHDRQQMYRMGEVLNAWYRRDSEVEVCNRPNVRTYYGWGKNAWMFTHGLEYKRQRDDLTRIMATECPADIWVASEGGSREIHTGHNHIGLAGRYVPTGDLYEARAIRVRSLSGMTPEDAWHHEQGYKHRRTASALTFRKSGGLAGIHEFDL